MFTLRTRQLLKGLVLITSLYHPSILNLSCIITVPIMDYMSLGIKSRKTGLNVKDNIKKDEYSMESIDDFFNDDDSSVASTRVKGRRRSTMLSILSNNENFPSPPIERRRESLALDSKGFKIPNGVADSSRRSTGLPQQYQHDLGSSLGLGTIEEDQVNDYQVDDVGKTTPPLVTQESFNQGYDGDSFRESFSVRLTPQAEKSVAYSKPPDLIEDDEDTRDFTSLNTSENALLEDELDDDYVAESEEDHDYVEGESILADNNSSEDTDESDGSGEASQSDDSDAEKDLRVKSTTSQYGRGQGFAPNSPTEVYDSDEEYIQSQAANLIGNDNRQSEGVRRSTRVKVAPLEYWRNEKIVYRKKSDKPVLEIDRIITFDHDQDEEEERLIQSKKKPKKQSVRTRPYNYIPTGRPRGRPRKSKASLMNNLNPNADLLQEIRSGDVSTAEWLKYGILEAEVNGSKGQVSDQIIAFAPNVSQSEQIKETADESFALEVLFDKNKDQFASGVLKLPINGKKKLSDSYNACVTFFVIQGILEFWITGKSFIMTEGSSFQVPAFNEYSFENKGNNEVRLFFVQVTVLEQDRELEDGSVKSTENTEHRKVQDSDRVAEPDAHQQNFTSSSNMSMSEI